MICHKDYLGPRDRRPPIQSVNEHIGFARQLNHTLNHRACTELAKGLRQLMSLSGEDYQLLLIKAREINSKLQLYDPQLKEAYESLKQRNGASLLSISSITPHPDDVYPVLHSRMKAFILAATIGEFFNYVQDDHPQVITVQDLGCERAAPQDVTTDTSRFHSDLAYLAPMYRPEYVMVSGHIDTALASFRFAQVDDLCDELTRIGEGLLSKLEDPVFQPIPPSPKSRQPRADGPTSAIISRNRRGERMIACDLGAYRIVGGDDGHRTAMDCLSQIAREVASTIPLDPSTTLIMRNDRGIHQNRLPAGRSQIVKINMRSDLEDLRWTCSTTGRLFDLDILASS